MVARSTPGHRGRWAIGTTVAAVATAGVIAGVTGLDATTPAGSAAVAPERAAVAQTRLTDTRAVLTATRTRGDTATVRLRVLTRAGDQWRDAGTELVGRRRGWFWHVVSGQAAVCEFGVANTPRPAVAVRLTISASIGCETRTRHFHVEDGDLVPG